MIFRMEMISPNKKYHILRHIHRYMLQAYEMLVILYHKNAAPPMLISLRKITLNIIASNCCNFILSKSIEFKY